jgi:hypothetical protein
MKQGQGPDIADTSIHTIYRPEIQQIDLKFEEKQLQLEKERRLDVKSLLDQPHTHAPHVKNALIHKTYEIQ